MPVAAVGHYRTNADLELGVARQSSGVTTNTGRYAATRGSDESCEACMVITILLVAVGFFGYFLSIWTEKSLKKDGLNDKDAMIISITIACVIPITMVALCVSCIIWCYKCGSGT